MSGTQVTSGEQYSTYLNYANEREKEWRNAKLMMKVSDRKYSRTRQGHYTAYLFASNSPLKTMNMFSATIPPGNHSGMHRHNCEAMIYIARGKGYSTIDGVRYEWEQGDAVAIPPMSWHQHFNLDPKETAEYIAVTNIPLLMGEGVFVLEQKEDAPQK